MTLPNANEDEEDDNLSPESAFWDGDAAEAPADDEEEAVPSAAAAAAVMLDHRKSARR